MVEVTKTVVGGNVWSKVVEKFFIGLGIGIIGLALTYGIDFFSNTDLSGLPTWFIAWVPFIVAVLTAAQNAWAHREKVVEVPIAPPA
jgi:hypothetical protein